jgi:signal transduction histidine kinase
VWVLLALLTFVFLVVFSVNRYRLSRHLQIAHKRLQIAYRQMEENNVALQAANIRAEESTRMKTAFIKQISHEIRTPLNILSGFTQIVTTPGMDLDNEERADINRQITENTNRITSLVNKMLELSDANSRSVIKCNDTVPAMQIAAQAIDASGIANASHLDFNMEMDEGAEKAMLTTNLSQATRALTLVLDNARKFTRPAEAHQRHFTDMERQHATLFLKQSGNAVKFIVEDTGIGIPAAEADHIFDEFVQLNEYYDGTGIGLTVARSIARRLGGDIVLDTYYTSGARFVMTLPI